MGKIINFSHINIKKLSCEVVKLFNGNLPTANSKHPTNS